MKVNGKMIKSMVLEYGLILITANSKYFMKMGKLNGLKKFNNLLSYDKFLFLLSLKILIY